MRVRQERVPELVLRLPLELRGRLVEADPDDGRALRLVLAPDIAVPARLRRAARSVGLKSASGKGEKSASGKGKSQTIGAGVIAIRRRPHLGVRKDDEVLVLEQALEGYGLVVLCMCGGVSKVAGGTRGHTT